MANFNTLSMARVATYWCYAGRQICGAREGVLVPASPQYNHQGRALLMQYRARCLSGLCAVLACVAVSAQPVPVVEAPEVIVVTGQLPGPPLWRVRGQRVRGQSKN
jgi:hypothetical protein